MLDYKTKNCIIENFEIAAKEFNFNFVAPYYIGKNSEMCFFAHLFKENEQKGVLIDILCDFDEKIDIEKQKYCRANNRFYSCLYMTPRLVEYKRSFFSEMLKDWKYEF